MVTVDVLIPQCAVVHRHCSNLAVGRFIGSPKQYDSRRSPVLNASDHCEADRQRTVGTDTYCDQVSLLAEVRCAKVLTCPEALNAGVFHEVDLISFRNDL
jgi:hypothetical protein